MSNIFVVCRRSRDILEQSVTGLSSATDLVSCLNSQWQICRLPQISWPAGTVSDKYVALKVTREICYLLALPGQLCSYIVWTSWPIPSPRPNHEHWLPVSCVHMRSLTSIIIMLLLNFLIHLFIYDGNKSPIIVFLWDWRFCIIYF